MEEPDVLTELSTNASQHIRMHHSQTSVQSRGDVKLPYLELGGSDFERLCSLVLLGEGRIPRYFGKNGSKDYGVDVIVSNGEACDVFQCKNVSNYKSGDFSSWLGRFEAEWLTGRKNLPKPASFTIVTSLDLREKDEVEEAKVAFWKEHRVGVEIWDRTVVNQKLKLLPDVVSDLFTPQAAQTFCELDHQWVDGSIVPITNTPKSGQRALDRFVNLGKDELLVSDEFLQRKASQILQDYQLVGIVGPSGSGKTVAALDLAIRMSHLGACPWYIDMRSSESARLMNDIQRRSHRPSVFVLDDCHLSLDNTRDLLTRRRVAWPENPPHFILTITTTASSSDELDEGAVSVFLDEEFERSRIVALKPTDATYREIILRSRPDLLSSGAPGDQTVQHLRSITGDDLFLLDEVLRSSAPTASERSNLTLEGLQEVVLRRYLGNRFPEAPNIRRIAALAQFDVAVPKSSVEPPEPMSNPMLASVGRPPAWVFAHTALAKLIFAALTHEEVQAGRTQYIINAVVAHISDARLSDNRKFQDLARILESRLAQNRGANRQVKEELLKRTETTTLIESVGVPLSLVVEAHSRLSLDQTPSRYGRRLIERLRSELENGAMSVETLASIPNALRAARTAELGQQAAFLDHVSPECYISRMAEAGGLIGLLQTLSVSTEQFADEMLDLLDEELLKPMIQRTQSMKTLGRALNTLGQVDNSRLERIESLISPDSIIQSFRSHGNLQSTLKVLLSVTPQYAAKLVDRLDTTTLDAILRSTIAEGKSLNSLAIRLRELNVINSNTMASFERKFGLDRFVQLMHERGDLYSFAKLISILTPSFSEDLVRHCGHELFDRLVAMSTNAQKTGITQIGRNRTILRALALHLSPQKWWDLIAVDYHLLHFSRLLGQLDIVTCQRLFHGPAYESNLWVRFLDEANSYGAAHFLSIDRERIDAAAYSDLERAVVSSMSDIVARSSWSELSSARSMFRRMPGTNQAPASFNTHLSARLAGVDLVSPQRIDDLTQATNLIHLLAELRPKEREEVNSALFHVLPPPDDWGSGYQRMINARLLLQFVQSEQAPTRLTQRLFESSLAAPADLTPKVDSKIVFLYLFNVWGARIRLATSGANALSESQSVAFWDEMKDYITARVPYRANTKKLWLLALAGLLDYCGVFPSDELALELRAGMRGASYLLSEADQLSAVPRFFTYRGLVLLDADQPVDDLDRQSQLLAAFDDYETWSPAVWLIQTDTAQGTVAAIDRAPRRP